MLAPFEWIPFPLFVVLKPRFGRAACAQGFIRAAPIGIAGVAIDVVPRGLAVGVQHLLNHPAELCPPPSEFPLGIGYDDLAIARHLREAYAPDYGPGAVYAHLPRGVGVAQ